MSRGIQMRRVCVFVVCFILALPGETQALDIRHEPVSSALQDALTQVLQATSASAVVLRWSDGAVLAKRGGEIFATPGSVMKPLMLDWALTHGVVRGGTKVFCQRSLKVGTLSLPCTHPPDQTTFTAQSALAESCNTYFAALGARMHGVDLEAALRAANLPHLNATEDNTEQRQLTVLGLRGVTASPLRLAQAYREMMQKEAPGSPVLRGLADSVQFGMADPARVEGVKLLGKTGTASGAGESWTHGWFAGALPGKMVVVIYLPRGNGGDAAALAGKFVRAALAGQK